MIRVKICGITRMEDAITSAAAGADLVGFVLAPSARRADLKAVGEISRRLRREWPRVARVGVFVDPSPDEIARAAEEADLTHVQIHGRIPTPMPADRPWIAALALATAEDAAGAAAFAGPADGAAPWALLVEPKDAQLAGGTGRTLPWAWAAPLVARHRVIIAGGLDADRVSPLLGRLTPYGVDASSRLEVAPGIKDPAKIRAFVAAVRAKEKERGTE